MWSRRDAASTLALATVFLVVALLLFPPVSWPSNRNDAQLVAWYLKGGGDEVGRGNGFTITHLVCTPTRTTTVACTLTINKPAQGNFCGHGRFQITGFTVTGVWSPPKPCHVKAGHRPEKGPGA